MVVAAFVLSVLALLLAAGAFTAGWLFWVGLRPEGRMREPDRAAPVDLGTREPAVAGIAPAPSSIWDRFTQPRETAEEKAYREATGVDTDAVVRGRLPSDQDEWDVEHAPEQVMTPAPGSKLRAEPPG